MSTLTKEEKAWIKKLQAVLDACPSDRIGFYTIGDPTVYVYDRSKEREINAYKDGESDFCHAVEHCEASFCEVTFPSPVHSTAG